MASPLDDLLEHLKRARYLVDQSLEHAFRQVPVEEFTDFDPQQFYDDRPVLFFHEEDTVKTISAPHMISIMLQELELEPGMDVLVCGAKSGYIAALISEMVGEGKVTILEANEHIYGVTLRNLQRLDRAEGCQVIQADPLLGLENDAPWDRVLVTGQIPAIPEELKGQLSETGFLLAPVGSRHVQEFTKCVRVQPDQFQDLQMGSVIFGPVESALASTMAPAELLTSELSFTERFLEEILSTKIEEIVVQVSHPPLGWIDTDEFRSQLQAKHLQAEPWQVCATCKALNPRSNRFCGQCGAMRPE